MLDMRYVRDNLEEVKKALKNRGLEISLEEFARKENKRRAVLNLLSLQRQRRNALSEEVGKKKKTGMNDEAQPLIDQVKEINFEIKQLEAHLEQYDPWVRDFLLGLPNLPDA
ncbi:MAG: serine--tRNA ligase, partial [Thermodesulfobacteriota bacterium]